MNFTERRSLLSRLRPYLLVFDGPLALIVFLILAVGLITLYSAGIGFPGRVEDQVRNILISFMLMWIVAIIPPPMEAPAATPPALVVTSDTDGDALGLVRQPAQRRRAFETLRPGTGWLLALPATSHAALAGTLAPEGSATQDQHHGGESMGGMGRQRGGLGGGQGGAHGPAGGAPRGPRSGSATEAAQADLQEALRLSTAFLDARLSGGAMPASPLISTR